MRGPARTVQAPGTLRTNLIDARQRGVGPPAEVGDRSALHPGIPGSTVLTAVAVDVSATGADSILSDVVHQRLIESGLMPDDVPVTVAIAGFLRDLRAALRDQGVERTRR